MKNPAEKVTAGHLSRRAYLYVRQSTLRQVAENRESTERQYALRERALALGWPQEQVEVIDCDLGQSGASADREGFQRLVAEVGMGRAGIVLGLAWIPTAPVSQDSLEPEAPPLLSSGGVAVIVLPYLYTNFHQVM